jgi:hypothetical protein
MVLFVPRWFISTPSSGDAPAMTAVSPSIIMTAMPFIVLLIVYDYWLSK